MADAREQRLKGNLNRSKQASKRAKVLEEVAPEAEPTRFGRRYGRLEHLEEAMKEQAGEARTPYQARGERKSGGKRVLGGGRELYRRIRDDRMRERAPRRSPGETAEQDQERGGLTPGGRLRARRRRGRRGEEDGGDPRKPSKLGKNEEFPAGKPAESSKEMEAFMRKWMGAMWLRTLWSWLWPSFGHVIYLINLTFLTRLLSDYFKRWIPEVGSEWFYISPAMRVGVEGKAQKGRSSKASRSGAKAGIMIVKVGELLAIGLITFFVAMFDLFIIIIVIFIVVTFLKLIEIIPGL